ncbi:hypothetical protein GCM10011380_08710 [Sphingomonas metalli]|uniref:Uncharacterized protein n=1 Tax=Sphingomonas metalli TaxID=1779358 RepID=A0A916SXL6_9SPHN|nr:hypothetical protein [Sphingomonas metalli]GGB21409.1 hypothetical protein GCM10011380_08710 [Sphingomonas metalli]
MSRWLILRTSGGQTLPLAASLGAAGFAVWTPARVLRRSIPAKTPSGKRLIATDAPILPTFVFAAEADLLRLAAAAVELPSPHPAFSIYRHGGRVPLVGDSEIAGLREEEAREAAVIRAMREAESHAAAEAIRIAAIKSEAARRRATRELERKQRAALRAKPCQLAPGTVVEVAEMPALIGVPGVVESVDGAHAHVRFGTQSWKIEGWRVYPSTLSTIAA